MPANNKNIRKYQEARQPEKGTSLGYLVLAGALGLGLYVKSCYEKKMRDYINPNEQVYMIQYTDDSQK